MAESNRYMKEALQQWINAPQFDVKEKVEAVIEVYDFFNIKELARNEMKKHYSNALTCLNTIPVNPLKKEKLIALAESLMVREN